MGARHRDWAGVGTGHGYREGTGMHTARRGRWQLGALEDRGAVTEAGWSWLTPNTIYGELAMSFCRIL